jgi:Putative auto-transporter adhesin, head GIN domain
MTHSSTIAAALGTLVLTLSGCSCWGVDGNGDRVTESRQTSAFSRVRSDCDLDVEIVQGDESKLTVSIDSNLMDYVHTRVEGDTLHIDLTEDVGRVVEGPQVIVTTPSLTAAKLAGSGALSLELDEPKDALDLYLSGSGDLRFRGKTAALGAHLSGSGSMRLSGTTSDAELILSGSGEIRARDLTATSASIDLSGSGDITATVTDSVVVELNGSGDVDIYGGASLDGVKQNGSGDITQH